MSTNFSWTCTYCNRDTTITEQNHTIGKFFFYNGRKEGWLVLVTWVITCPNPNCKEHTIKSSLFNGEFMHGEISPTGEPLLSWKLKPQSSAKPIPKYVPSAIIADYNEACLIRDLSPKASATLARRCLQGMIRDYWGISKSRLVDEIKALEDKVDGSTWAAIDAVRNIGNIGAHMEKDINVIVDVDPEEAQLLIGLIEMLIKEWYVARHDRDERMKQLIALATEKKPLKQ